VSDIEALFAASRARFAQFLETIDAYAAALARIGDNRPPEPRWDQVWFPRLDACAAYVMVRTAKPARIVEIGAGHSTRFLARAIRDEGLDARLTAIDPDPRASLAGLDIEWIARTVQETALPPLAAGDILFIDSSHVHAPASDVAVLLEAVFPALAAGVLVHVHDIFLPDPYPAQWAYRRYNEQEKVAELLDTGAAAPLFASRYVATHMADALAASAVARLPLAADAFENSLWLRKL
jgi:predicted O-methyltransferase YrrM